MSLLRNVSGTKLILIVLLACLTACGCTPKLIGELEAAARAAAAAAAAAGATAVAGNMSLEVPIEILDAKSLSVNQGAVVTWERTRISFDETAYDGTRTYFFEVVACNSDAGPVNVYLVDETNTVTATLPIPAGTGNCIPAVPVMARLRGAWTPTAGAAHNYRIRTDGSIGVDYTAMVFSARMIVKQTGASKTRIYIPLLASEDGTANAYNGDTAVYSDSDVNTGASAATSALGQPAPSLYSIWLRDKDVFNQLNGATPWTFEALLYSANGVATASLYNRTTNALVTAVTAGAGGGLATLQTSSFADNAGNFNTDDEEFEVRLHVTVAGGGGACDTTLRCASIYRAGIWVALSNFTHGEVYYRVSKAFTNGFTTTYSDSSRMLYSPTSFILPAPYFETTSYYTGTTGYTAFLGDTGATVSDILPVSLVAGTTRTMPLTLALKARQRSALLSLTDSSNYIIGFANANTDNFFMGSSLVVVKFGQ